VLALNTKLSAIDKDNILYTMFLRGKKPDGVLKQSKDK
jgi:hypothetical protein